MDVQTVTGTAGSASSGLGVTAVAEPPASQVAASALTASAPIVPAGTSTNATSPANAQPKGISPAIARIFGNGAPLPQQGTLDVSYRVVKDPNEIVIVFTDPKTGKEVAQFPPDLFAQLANMLDHQRGATLDQSA
jgi:uncharacterized FlaG/YvyC family protein